MGRLEISSFPRNEWSPLPYEGVSQVLGRVLLTRKDLVVAMLNFAGRATIHEHAAEHEIDVICLEGRGFTSVEKDVAAIEAGQSVYWPARKRHRLSTEGFPMLTLMVEHPEGYRP